MSVALSTSASWVETVIASGAAEITLEDVTLMRGEIDFLLL